MKIGPDPAVSVLVVVAGVLLLLGLWLKRRVVGSPEPEAPISMGGFGMAELREMHRRGELSDEEFERAKEKLVARMKARADAKELPPDDRSRPKDLDLIRDVEP